MRPAEGGSYLQLRVSPGAKSNALKGLYGKGAIKLAVAAPPAGGRANAEVERYLASLFGLSRLQLSVVKGTSSRDKLIFINGATPDEVRTRLGPLL